MDQSNGGGSQTNVAGEAIDGALPRQPAVKAHFRALPYREIGTALATVEASGASLAAKLTLKFVVLTACRSGEVRLAEWSEIDMATATWTIPGSRMKNGAEHRVCRGTKVVENRSDRWNQAESGGRWRNLKGMRGVVNGGRVAAGGRKSLRIRSGSDRESAGNDDFRGVSGVLKGP